MKNRAKCKLCKQIIESFHPDKWVSCHCGEISINGGESKLGCQANDFGNFIRVDDNGNEISVQYDDLTPKKPSKEELMKMFAEMIKKIDELPPIAMSTSINHYDYYNLMVMLYAILESKENKDA